MGEMTYKDLRPYRDNQRDEFFAVALRYANYLWMQGLPARALLAMDRALFADLRETDQVLNDYEIPYCALVWFLRNPQEGKFIGNPRVHYQHLADRVQGERSEIKKWRTWACWYLTCLACPGLEGDPSHTFDAPTQKTILKGLEEYGISQDIRHFNRATEMLIG